MISWFEWQGHKENHLLSMVSTAENQNHSNGIHHGLVTEMSGQDVNIHMEQVLNSTKQHAHQPLVHTLDKTMGV